MDYKQRAELIKALLRLSNAVNDLSQELLELLSVNEVAVLDEEIAQAAYLLRATVQALDAALEFHNAAHKQMQAADADRASDGSTTGPAIESQPNQSTQGKKRWGVATDAQSEAHTHCRPEETRDPPALLHPPATWRNPRILYH
jgi:hypothetical protein